jgi:streptogramin lyase
MGYRWARSCGLASAVLYGIVAGGGPRVQVVAATGEHTASGLHEARDPSHGSVVGVDAETGEVLTVLATGPDPLLLCVAAGRVWTMNFGDGTMTRVDPLTDAATTLDVGEAAAIACGGDDVWVARDGNVVARLSGATGEEEIALQLGDEPLFALRDAGFVGIAGGSVWLTVPAPDARFSEEMWRIDPRTGSLLATIPIGRDANPPLADREYLWVVTKGDQGLTRIDVRTNESVAVDVDRFPYSLAAGDGSLWIGHHVASKLRRVDPHTLEMVAELPLEADPRGLAFGGGQLWVTTENTLLSVDPATNEVTRTIELGSFPRDTGLTGVAYLDDTVWVSIE